MTTPNWQHHSKKEQKRHLKPQALRAAKKRAKMLKKKLMLL
ncbi:cAMP phosphodiesterase protein [Synechococcus phage S-H9-2]|uniref:cAMP phosphodiesterase protein n=1 Tax=Synechococcus phage S-H9-2 TaxID=2783669 RepID=A0A873WEI1_9CAUD|nr:cAMP phosphodiesterase protein [Synechococcus phage S-H9-2]QPB08448.1 cAMP phosphodiesterase protein [Synechococcus phage S-H9-2]